MTAIMTNAQFEKLRHNIKWRGKVTLYQLNEDDESLLTEFIHKGQPYYACATTGLLFDKDTGQCLTSSNVELRIETLRLASPREYPAFVKRKKMADYGYNIKFDHMKDEDESDE